LTAQSKLFGEASSRGDLEQVLWKAADILRGAVRPERYGNYILPLLFFKRLSDVYEEEYQAFLKKYKDEEIARSKFHRFVIPKGCQWEDIRSQSKNIGQKLNDVLAQIAKANPELDGVINRVDFNKQDEIPKERLVRLIEQFSQIKLGNKDAEPDVLGNAYEYLLKKFNEEAPQRAGEFYTPREVVWTMVSILDPQEGFEVYDPCCGSGGMLIMSHYYLASKREDPRKLFLYGEELNAETWALSTMNVLLHDMEAEIRQGDSIADPKFLEGQSLKHFDIVLANPMWNQDGYRQLMETDKFDRFSYGITPDGSADWGWIQHMLASLKSDGRMGIVLDQGALSRGGSEGKIRQKIVDADLVECVISLPPKIFYNTGSPGSIIFLNRKKPQDHRGKTLFIYATDGFEKLRNMNRLRDEDIGRIVNTYRKFASIGKFSKVVNRDEMKSNDYNLSVTRYVDAYNETEPVDVAGVWAELQNLEAKRSAIDNELASYLKELGYER
jgi:type I restriction enzyme M protein